MLNDLRYAFRMLMKSPGFSLATILILALGIGGVTAMFSTLYTVMIRPLPYDEPDRLVLGRATFSGNINPWVAGPDFADYRDKNRSFASFDAFAPSTNEVTTSTGQSAHRADRLFATVGLFPALGVKMLLGRPFTVEEGQAGAPSVAIVSHAYWQRQLAGQTDIVGHSLVIDGVSYVVVGVTRPDFHFVFDVDVWFPLRPQNLGPRRFNNWYVLGRLKDGVTLAEAQSDVDVIAAQLEQAYPDTNAHKALLLTPLQGAVAEQYHSSFSMLCGGAGAILLIACANAAGLLLARGAGRQGELAVRAAMGASRWQLMRLLLAEALILAGVAGVMGAVVAVWIQGALLGLMPIETLLLGAVGLSMPVLQFVLGITLLTGLGFGLLPALQTRQVNLARDLRASGRGVLLHGMRVRGGLVVGQVALSFVLLVVAGLLIRSLNGLRGTDTGFNTRNLLTVEVPLPPRQYTVAQRPVVFSSLLNSIRGLPGVVSAAAIDQLPLRNPYNDISIYAVGAVPAKEQESPSGNQRVVLPGYFQTMGIPLLAGRDIEATDSSDRGRVVVISQTLADTLFPKRNPLGQHVVIDRGNDVKWEVVGVVGDVKNNSLSEETYSRGTFYRSYGQQTPPTMRLAIRTAGNSLAIVAPLRDLLQKLDPQIPLSGPRTMDDIMANSTVAEQAQAVYLTSFSLLALILVAVGIYGLLAYVVTRRQRDIGIRMALGAEPGAVRSMVLRSGMKLVGIGLGLGVIGALAMARILRSQLFGVSPIDSLTYGSVVLVLSIVASLACYLPARRAARVDPMVALRSE